MQPIDVLYEDNHLLVINKPAGIATMGTPGVASLHSLACQYVKQTYNKPGKVFLGIVSRLDSVTSGVIVMARTSKAASRLVPQFAEHDQRGASKIYLAIVEGVLPCPPQGDAIEVELEHYISKDDAAHRMRVVAADEPHAQLAKMKYRVLWRGTNLTLVAVRLCTGRKHQIRVQFAAIGHPLVGDRKYGSRRIFNSSPAVALHSWRLSVEHPTTKQPMH